MIGCWPDSNTPEPSAWCANACLQRGQVERRCRRVRRHRDLHDGARVRARSRAASSAHRRRQVGAAGVVVVARDPAGNAAGASLYRISVLPANFEKSTTVSARSAGASKSACLSTLPTSKRVGSVIHVSAGSERPPGPAGIRPRYRSGSSVGPCGLTVVSGVGTTFGSVCAAATSDGLQRDLAVESRSSGRRRTTGGSMKRSLAAFRMRKRYDFGCDRRRRIRRAVDDRRVVELLHPDRDVRRAGDLLRLAERVGLVLPRGRVVDVAARVVVRVRDRPVLRRCRRPEPWPVHPAAERAHAARVAGVLGGHVDVVVPEVARAAPPGAVPRRVLLRELGRVTERTSGPG